MGILFHIEPEFKAKAVLIENTPKIVLFTSIPHRGEGD
jgi:hypothetical protein